MVPSHVLILGNRQLAGRIAESIRAAEKSEFIPLVHESEDGKDLPRLPSLGDPLALDRLRDLLVAFRARFPHNPIVHPGVTSWGERTELAALGQELGITVITPPPRVLTLFINRLNLLIEAERLGIPNLLLSADPVSSLREIDVLLHRHRQAFPFVLKAAKAGAPSNHFVVRDREDLESRLPIWIEQLRVNTGESILLVERCLEGARQILVPFARFSDGHFEAFPTVDVSLLLNRRKMVEFCPAERIEPRIEAKIVRYVEQLAESSGFVGVGSFEFLVDSARAYLISGSPRLSSSFLLWEKVAGTSAAGWQLAAHRHRSAAQAPERKPDRCWNSAVAVRLYAEDPILQLPQPGFVQELSELRKWSFSGGMAELEWMVREKSEISPMGSSLVALLVAGSHERSEAVNLARGVLDEIWISGSLQTNGRFVSELLSHPWVKEGIFHAGFVEEDFLPAIRPPVELLPLFVAVCALVASGVSDPESLKWVVGDQWAKSDAAVPFKWLEGPHFFEKAGVGKGLSGVIEGPSGGRIRVGVYPLGSGSSNKWQARIGHWDLVVRGVPAGAKRKQPRISALAAGRVHSILYREGARVPAHEPLLVLESLGMLVPHALPVEVRIQRWKVAPEEVISAGTELADFEIIAKGT